MDCRKPFVLVCSPNSFSGLQQQSIYLSTVNIFLSITAILGNSPILVALHRESSLHPSSKLLYRCICCPTVGAEIQRYCNFEAHLYPCSYRLDWCLDTSLTKIFDQRITAFYGAGWTTFIAHFTRRVHKDFSHSQTSSGTSTRSYSTTAEPTKCTEHGAIRKSSAQWVQSVLVVCYTPQYIVEIEVTYSKTYSSHLVVTRAMVNILVYFNSTLNPFFLLLEV